MIVLISTYLHYVLLLSLSVYICSRFVTYWYSVCWCSTQFLLDEYACVFFGVGCVSKVVVFSCLPT